VKNWVLFAWREYNADGEMWHLVTKWSPACLLPCFSFCLMEQCYQCTWLFHREGEGHLFLALKHSSVQIFESLKIF